MTKILRALLSAALLAGLTLFAPQVATAEDPTIFGPFPACKDFNVSFSSTSGNQAERLERMKDGVFFTITAGSGTIITFNAVDKETEEILNSVTFDTKGSVTKTRTTIVDGVKLTTFQVTGFGTLLLFEGTDPDGPSTTVFNGKVTFTLDEQGNQVGEVVNSGRTFDICAALSAGI